MNIKELIDQKCRALARAWDATSAEGRVMRSIMLSVARTAAEQAFALGQEFDCDMPIHDVTTMLAELFGEVPE